MKNRTLLQLLVGLGSLVVVRAAHRRLSRFDLQGKVVVVTGGSRGLGLLLSRELVRRGARIAICARDPDELERAQVDLARMGGTVLVFPCDLTDRDAIFDFLAKVEQQLGPVDVLINNAGVIQVGPMETMTPDDYELAMKIHLWAPLHASLAVLPSMRARRSGRIVNIASIGAKVAVPHLLPYSASKFALYGLSAGMRAELAKDGVLVTTICPGLMRTGSPRNALIKGQHEAEYAWFDIADSLPVISMNAERAARQILDACERGDAELVLSAPGKLLARIYGLSPTFVQNVLGIVTRMLPGPNGASTRAVKGYEAESDVAPSFLTSLGQAAARQNNEL
jgi:NAD(P)-dependent dehydrogenase (short-subunit alcohol dehydrogenase family)